MNRREFLSASVGAGCALAALPAVGARPELRVALVGCGPRGLALADTAIHGGGCQITAAWDADPALAHSVAASHGATAYLSVGELLVSASPQIAILTARPEPAVLLELLQAGAHLFLDTFPTASRAESRAVRKEAGASGKAVHVNLGRAGISGCPETLSVLRSGRIGQISTIRTHVHHHHPMMPDVDRSALLDWAGEILALSGEGPPRRVTATGHEQDQVVTWEFDGLTAIWEQRVFPGAVEERVSTGATWYGSHGVLRLDGNAWRLTCHTDARDARGTISARGWDAACWAELLGAIREQRQPRRRLEVALNAAEMVRLAECSLKLERPLEWDSRRRLVVGDADANRLLRSAPEWQA